MVVVAAAAATTAAAVGRELARGREGDSLVGWVGRETEARGEEAEENEREFERKVRTRGVERGRQATDVVVVVVAVVIIVVRDRSLQTREKRGARGDIRLH